MPPRNLITKNGVGSKFRRGIVNGSEFILPSTGGSYAEAICAEFDLSGVVIVGLMRDGHASIITSADSQKQNASLELWAKQLVVGHMSIVPFGTLFGFANGGEPVQLSEQQKRQAAYAAPLYKEFLAP